MSYYIKQLEHNTYNHYKYHYLDHINAVIDIRQNYWSFAIDLFTINDFKLPISSLAGDLQLPYQLVQNIAFNLNSDQSRAKESVEYNKEYCRIYSSNFDVDISQNEFFKQDLQDMKLNFELSLFIDPEAAKGAGTDITQDDLDNLINETSEQRWNFNAYYTNTHLIEQTDTVDNISGFNLPFGNVCIAISRQIKVSCNNLSNQEKPFNNLTNISSVVPFQVLTGKVKFYYWLEFESQVKTLEVNLNIDKSLTNSLTINFDNSTIFDYEKNEIVVDPIGPLGFYIPKYSQGYYELELQILQSNSINKFIIKNNFNFVRNIDKPYIAITHRVIDSLEGFKEVIF